MYLTTQDIERMMNTKLYGTEDVVRDRFVIGCVTGLRHSDYRRLNSEHLEGNLINILTKKVNRNVYIPIHPYVYDIMDKWRGNIPKVPNLAQFNQVLKRVGLRSKLRSEVIVEYKNADGSISLKRVMKYKLLGSHTARRSFATNAYKAGIPVRNIMLITGHTSELTFFRYIMIKGYENAIELAEHPYFNLQRPATLLKDLII